MKKEKNPWRTSTVILAVLCLTLIAVGTIPQMKDDYDVGVSNEAFLELAKSGKMLQFCNLETGTCVPNYDINKVFAELVRIQKEIKK